jgi:hypothetical protein
VRSGRVVARAAPHRRAVQCRARRGAAGLCVAVRSACCCAAAVGCDFFNCWGFVLALASGLSWHCRPDWW